MILLWIAIMVTIEAILRGYLVFETVSMRIKAEKAIKEFEKTQNPKALSSIRLQGPSQ